MSQIVAITNSPTKFHTPASDGNLHPPQKTLPSNPDSLQKETTRTSDSADSTSHQGKLQLVARQISSPAWTPQVVNQMIVQHAVTYLAKAIENLNVTQVVKYLDWLKRIGAIPNEIVDLNGKNLIFSTLQSLVDKGPDRFEKSPGFRNPLTQTLLIISALQNYGVTLVQEDFSHQLETITDKEMRGLREDEILRLRNNFIISDT